MKIDAKSILKQASIGKPANGSPLSIEILSTIARKSIRSIYNHRDQAPIPLWLLQSITEWYQQHGPIQPSPVDAAFKWYMAKAYKQALPSNPFTDVVKVGRPKAQTFDDDGDEPDDSNGKGKKKRVFSYAGENPQQGESESAKAPVSDNGSLVSGENDRDRDRAISNARNDASHAYDSARDATNVVDALGGAGEVSGVLPNTPLCERARQALDAASGVSDTGNLQGARPAGERGRSAAPHHQPISSNNVKATALIRQIETWDDACAEYRTFKAFYSHAKRKALCNAIRARFSKYFEASDDKIIRALARATGVRLRKRSRPELVVEREQALVQVVYQPFVAKRSRPYAKGAYAEKAKTTRRTIIAELFTEQKDLSRQVADVFDDPRFAGLKRPDQKNLVAFLEKVIRKVDGGANPAAEVRPYQQPGLAPRGVRSGEIVYLDASTVKAAIRGGFGTASDDGYQKPFYFLARDVASRMVWGYTHTAQSEDYGWGGGLPSWESGKIVTSGNALMQILFEAGCAWDVASIDRKSGVATQLLYLDPEKPINVMPGVLAWMASGTIWHIRQGGRKTGGSYVERDIRTVQDYVEGVEARLSIDKELAGMGFRKERAFDSEIEYRRSFNESIEKVRRLLVQARSGFQVPDGYEIRSRAQIWDSENATRKNLLAPDAPARWMDIVRKARVCTVSKRRVKFGYGKESLFANLEGPVSDLNGPLTDYSGEEQIALAIPGGMLAGDPADLVRVFIIDRREGRLPRILRSEAHIASVDEYCQDVRRPTKGHYYSLPDRESDKRAKERENAGDHWKKKVGALADEKAAGEVIEARAVVC